ncbi:MAG: hypothetical protein CMK65_02030 [Pseudoalteromonas sp.]|uniref:hypothetical protein n=1 Tax=Pseudoalteromonas sp. TaxID=53249 RepID=UPI000C932C34|nr:hypothetical protein [Pseudoalteromonas sp.]MAD02394.1 hypothetical protein [Pseudoalteromonas sp.]|tara:strand:- start:94 stop:279 length:186 start_codon:yes stop_codon:yes gene_type:complete
MNNLLKTSFINAAIFTFLTIANSGDSQINNNSAIADGGDTPNTKCIISPIFCDDDDNEKAE